MRPPRWCLVVLTDRCVARPLASAPSAPGGSRAGSPTWVSAMAIGSRRCCGTRPSTSSCTSRFRSMGAVIHTLNPRLSADDLSYIAADAEDRVVVVDESLLHVLDSIEYDFEQVIVVSDSRLVAGWNDRVRVAHRGVRADELAGDRRATGRRDVLHVGDDGPPEGSDLFASGAGPALACLRPAGRASGSARAT